eukprot:g5911.t1
MDSTEQNSFALTASDAATSSSQPRYSGLLQAADVLADPVVETALRSSSSSTEHCLAYLGDLRGVEGVEGTPPLFGLGFRKADHMPAHLHSRALRAITLGSKVAPAELPLLCRTAGLLRWNLSHVYGGDTGELTEPNLLGTRRTRVDRDSRGPPLFPRTDPVVIVAIVAESNNAVLLGRSASWPAGRFSCLAGFVDAGETIEEAVAREVMEEVGLAVDPADVEYVASQPWPNGPAPQLMIGCKVRVPRPLELNVDQLELEAARW